MTVLKAGDLTAPELLELLGQVTVPNSERIRCWLESTEGWAFDEWQGPANAVRWNAAGRRPREAPVESQYSHVFHGRLFSLSGELRWRILPALGVRCYRVVYLGDGWSSPLLEALPARDELSGLAAEIAEYPLWGQQTRNSPGEWIDLRIPHRLRYPVAVEAPKIGRVIARIQVQIWRDCRAEIQFIRFRDVVARWEE